MSLFCSLKLAKDYRTSISPTAANSGKTMSESLISPKELFEGPNKIEFAMTPRIWVAPKSKPPRKLSDNLPFIF